MKAEATIIRFVQDRDGGVLLDIERDRFFSVNHTAATIWDQLDRGKTLDDIAEELSLKTGVAIHVIVADAQQFLSDLESQGLLLPLRAIARKQELP